MKKAIWLAVLYTAVMGAGKAYVKHVKGVGYSDPATRTWLEFGESFLEVVETFEVLDNNAFYSQVVTPDFLHPQQGL